MKIFFLQILCNLFDIFKPNKILVLFYHSINNGESRLSVNEDVFEKQIRYLKNKKFKSINPFDLDKKLKGKNVMICFDDGFADNLIVAQPILEKYNFKATIFIATKFIGSKSEYGTLKEDRNNVMLNQEQIRILEKGGWCIANHFHSHQNLIDLSDNDIIREINTSRKILKGIVKNKKSINIFSYPRNKINERILKLMKKMNVDLAFAGTRELVSKKSNKLALPRIEIDRDVNFDKFKLYLSPTYFFIRNKIFKR